MHPYMRQRHSMARPDVSTAQQDERISQQLAAAKRFTPEETEEQLRAKYLRYIRETGSIRPVAGTRMERILEAMSDEGIVRRVQGTMQVPIGRDERGHRLFVYETVFEYQLC